MKLTSIEIIKQLREAGYEAYWAGGCVRDMLLGIHPKDFDIATSAKPSEIKKIFEKVIPVGEKYGVVLIHQEGHHFEVATFRSDGGYSDGRRPDAIYYSSPQEDASRRDFSINALFYDPIKDQVLDFIDGQKDLDNGLVRFIGDPYERIIEDHLRILRAVRFKNTYNFQYHPHTFAALKKHSTLVSRIASERIRDELNKMIMHGSFTETLEDMEDTGILEVILPEIQAMKGLAQPHQYHQEGDLWDHMILAIKALKENAPLALRWAVFLHDVGKIETFEVKERIRYDHHAEHSAQIAQKILRRLAFPKKIIDDVTWLVEHHMSVYNVIDMTKGRRMHWFLQPLFLHLLELNRCDVMGTMPHSLDQYQRVLDLYRIETEALGAEPLRLLTGEDIIQLTGLAPGPSIKDIVEQLRYMQLEKKIMTVEAAKEWVKVYAERYMP